MTQEQVLTATEQKPAFCSFFQSIAAARGITVVAAVTPLAGPVGKGITERLPVVTSK